MTLPDSATPTEEWERRVQMDVDGMTVHQAANLLSAVFLIREEACFRGWSADLLAMDAEAERRLMSLLVRARLSKHGQFSARRPLTESMVFV
jgi:hypothetical protein